MAQTRRRFRMTVTASAPMHMKAMEVRNRVKVMLAGNADTNSPDVVGVAVSPPPKPVRVDLAELGDLLSEVIGTIGELQLQVEQMKDLFDDEDGTIEQALDDGEELIARIKSYRKKVLPKKK